MPLIECLEKIVRNLETDFQPDELAYLAATSKIENPIRDRIAFALHDSLGDGALIHRERKDKRGKKADIAITDFGNRPKYIIELKAHSAPTYEKGYSELIRRDIEKMYHAGDDQTELYTVFLFNHLYKDGEIDDRYQYALKYYDLLNHAAKLNAFAQDASFVTLKHWTRHMGDLGLSPAKGKAVPVGGGDYYDMPMTIHAFIYGPMYRVDVRRLLKSE
jgi:hypothetical protein